MPYIKWGPRNNTNIQQSGVLFSLSHFAKNKETYLENYWLKNKRSVQKGKDGPTFAWVIPATQRRKADAADAVNELRRQGLEIHTANSAFKVGSVDVKAGDYIVRADQPYRTLADMYFSLQNFAPQNPRPYDDTGWTFQLMRNVRIVPVTDKGIHSQPMTMLAADAKAPGGIATLITVADEGPGVPAKDRAKVFDPFFTTKAAGVGTGLGLAVCKHLVATAGGSIEVGDGPNGRGAEFRIVIPNA